MIAERDADWSAEQWMIWRPRDQLNSPAYALRWEVQSTCMPFLTPSYGWPGLIERNP